MAWFGTYYGVGVKKPHKMCSFKIALLLIITFQMVSKLD